MEMIENKLKTLGNSFEPFLSASNPVVVKSLAKLGHSPDAIRRIELFDWFQGVGLYGYYELYLLTKEEEYLTILLNYYQTRIDDGLPAKNINSMAPMLTLASLLADDLIGEKLRKPYLELVLEWAKWLYKEAPRTQAGGFAHLTCEAANAEELWDDTLFMAILFLAKVGVMDDKDHYVEEAIFQFLIHHQYLGDKESGFWFHGYTFDGHHNFVNAKWARGNSWITIFVPIFLEITKDYPLSEASKKIMTVAYKNQVRDLVKFQKADGLWPTLLDDAKSYSEASASAGFVWGIVKGLNKGLLSEDECLKECVDKGVKALLVNITEDGILEQVSGGTAMGKDSLDFYREIPLIAKPYGQAMAMAALIEVLKEKKYD